MQRDIYQEVTDRIVNALEAGITPWLKPWKDLNNAGFISEPHNAVSGRAYNGINWLVLQTTPYASKGWLTFRQAKLLGGNVKRGERGTQIIFWKFDRKRDEKTGTIKTIPFARAYTVFNLEQCEGIESKRVKLPTPPVPGSGDMNAVAAKHGVNLRHGGNRAFFSPSTDHVQMPSADAFKSADDYQSTLAHELTHWSGGASRLARDFTGARFGNEAYAFEELVAEIGSAFLCARTGIALEGLQHADYVGNWLKVLRDDKRAIFTAASKAKQASEFLLPCDAEPEEEEETEAAPLALAA